MDVTTAKWRHGFPALFERLALVQPRSQDSLLPVSLRRDVKERALGMKLALIGNELRMINHP